MERGRAGKFHCAAVSPCTSRTVKMETGPPPTHICLCFNFACLIHPEGPSIPEKSCILAAHHFLNISVDLAGVGLHLMDALT